MTDILRCYDLPLDQLGDLYRRLHTDITYPDGIVTNLATIYWGHEDLIRQNAGLITQLGEMGITRCSELLESIRTPGRMKKVSEQTGAAPDVPRCLRHDIERWLPKPTDLAEYDLVQRNPGYLASLRGVGINTQLDMLNSGRTPQDRERLARDTGIPVPEITEMVKLCDCCRTGGSLTHIRAKIYYDMGLDTLQKRAAQTAESTIAMFTEYIEQHHLSADRLVPWPREVWHGIEWAKLHLSIFTIEW
jgi:hypothetical protein